MANVFNRFPIDGGDNNAWGAYVLAQELHFIGEYSSYLFDSAGTLKISAGGIGINDGTNKGTSEIEETAIALTGTTGIWQKIEMGVSGSTVTFYSTDLAGETDPSVLPAAFTGGYVDAKRGYYIIGTRRTIGVVWVDSTGALGGVINGKGNAPGYHGYSYLDTAQTQLSEFEKSVFSYLQKIKYPFSGWDMDATVGITIAHSLGDWTKFKKAAVVVINNAGTQRHMISGHSATAQKGGVYLDSTNIVLSRFTGGLFDNAAFNAATGYAHIELEE